MTDNLGEQNLSNIDKPAANWQLSALTEALGDLTLTVSDSLSVGRGSDNDVVLGSKQVSRNHAVLSALDGQLYVKDLTSSNGTFVNNERIESNQSKLLKLNDTLGFASFNFTVLQPDVVVDTDADIAKDITTAPVTGADTTIDTQTDIEALSAGVESNITTDPVSSPSTSADPVVDLVQNDVSELASNEDEPPVVKKTIIEDVLKSSDSIDNNSIDNNSAAAMPTAAAKVTEPATSTPSTEIDQETVISSEIPKPPLVEEVAVTEPRAREPVVNEPVASESVTKAPVIDEPLMQEKASHQESVASPDRDKTTTTALQEEVDPEILRARQAATGQLSGTANLGADRDLGTEDNNAMTQAIDNPANAGNLDKKPSGGWFIWVFVALIIIAIALWLFNMGGA